LKSRNAKDVVKYRDKRPNYEHKTVVSIISRMPIPVASRSKASAAARLLGVWFRIPPGACLLCVFRKGCLLRADNSSLRVLPIVVCLSLISKCHQWVGQGPQGMSKHEKSIIHEGDIYSLTLSCTISLLGLESLDSPSCSKQVVN
jgi:hypothetical protein